MKSVLIDTNTLILWIVGNIDPGRLGGRRLEVFDIDDLRRLEAILSGFQRHVTLPNVLTEASNLLGSGKQELVRGGAAALADYCRFADEVYEASRGVVEHPEYARLGLTDAAIATLCDQETVVLTIDHELHGRLISSGVQAVNLLHSKTPG
jgi:rRNA-processing protein FCF1